MASKEFITDYGTVTVRNAVLEEDNGIDLCDGVEIKGESIGLIEVNRWIDVEDLNAEDVEKLIEDNQ